MTIAIIGAGNIGGNCAQRFALSGKHKVILCFSRDLNRLANLALQIGAGTTIAATSEAVAQSQVAVLAVPWDAIPLALHEAGSLAGKIVIDTTNQFGSQALPPSNSTAAQFNASRMPGAHYTKSFNTLTSGFQRETADRPVEQKIVQWICGDDADAIEIVSGLIEDAGYVPVVLGGTKNCQPMEAPRRHGAVYGEEYRAPDALAVLAALRSGHPIPPTPRYS